MVSTSPDRIRLGNSILALLTLAALLVQPLVGVSATSTPEAHVAPNNAPQATLIVDTLTDEDDGVCDVGGCSLRDAIALADPGDTIDFSVTGVINLSAGELTIEKDLTIIGPGAENLAVSGNNTSPVFVISGTVTLEGLTIRDGAGNSGGGVSISAGNVTLSETHILNNSGYYGGGVFIDTGQVVLSGGQIFSNTADYGGGVYIGNGHAVLDGAQIFSNTVINDGGGVYVLGGTAVLTQTSGTIEDNHATWGGGVYVEFGRAVLSGGEIVSNTAGSGGGVYALTC